MSNLTGTSKSFQSTHPMRGATAVLCYKNDRFARFQSTHPMRGATGLGYAYIIPFIFQSTHPMRGATRHPVRKLPPYPDFNPRTPCGVRRHPVPDHDAAAGLFQSTHPMRGATMCPMKGPEHMKISIHAPHAGCDCLLSHQFPPDGQFQSTHPMRGATCGRTDKSIQIHRFQSTHPMRGATRNARNAIPDK